MSSIPVHVASEDRSRRSQSGGSLGAQQRDQRASESSRSGYDPRHEFRVDSRSHRGGATDADHDTRPIPVEHEIPPDSGIFRGQRGGMGYDRGVLRIDHVDVSRPPPPLPFRGGPWPPDLDRGISVRGSADPRDSADSRHHGLLPRPPPSNWGESRGFPSHESLDTRRGVVRDEGGVREGLLPLPTPLIRTDGLPRVKTEELLATSDKTVGDAVPLPLGFFLFNLLLDTVNQSFICYTAILICHIMDWVFFYPSVPYVLLIRK